MAKLQNKDRILKAAREKQEETYKGAPIRLATDFSMETLQVVVRVIWLARPVSPSSLTDPCESLPKQRAHSKRTTFPTRGEDRSWVRGIPAAALPC